METDVSKVLISLGYTATRYEIHLKKLIASEISLWALGTQEGNEVIFTMGAIAPRINKFAFTLLKKSSAGNIKPQFPASVGPPIFIALHESFRSENVSSDDRVLSEMVAEFDKKYADYKIHDWFELASELIPYSHSSSILLPAYYYLENKMEELREFLHDAKNQKLNEEINAYLEEYNKLMSAI